MTNLLVTNAHKRYQDKEQKSITRAQNIRQSTRYLLLFYKSFRQLLDVMVTTNTVKSTTDPRGYVVMSISH